MQGFNQRTENTQPGPSKVNRKDRSVGIASNRTAQMMFRTSLRNFIDLTSIADNKANIMLSINAIIITITIPLLLGNLESNSLLIIPTIILVTTCVISIVFATLATRPIKMKGQPVYSKDPTGFQRSLFFFGNFFKMNFADYKSDVLTVVDDQNLLEDSIVSDLYYIGKTLGKKYNRIRLCYTFFMVGIIFTVLALAITYSIDPSQF